jgi:hypothetical protein
MTKNNDRRDAVRARMAATGEKYTEAARALDAEGTQPVKKDRPYRLVDVNWQGWHPSGNSGLYEADYGFERALDEPWSYERIAEERGPIRPVVFVPDADEAEAARLLQLAGKKAAASALAALYRAFKHFPGAHPHPLLAGREGSWESQRIRQLAWTIGGKLDEKPTRIHEETAAGLAAIVISWASRPDSYTEVAENYANLFSRHADAAGGWPAVADQWLQPGRGPGHDADTVHAVGSYLLSTSDGISAFLDAAGS